MGKKNQLYASFHLFLSNNLKHLPIHPPPGQINGADNIEKPIFDSFRSLGLSDWKHCFSADQNNSNHDRIMLESAQSDNAALLVPPSDRFFVSPSTSGSLACECNVPLHATSPSLVSEEMAVSKEDDIIMVRPSDRFFVSPSTSGLLALDQRAKTPDATSPSTSSNSNCASSTASDNFLLASSSASNSTDATSSSSASSSSDVPLIPADGIAVSTDSDDPYRDFKRSMQEMLHAHVEASCESRPLDWDFLEDLLFCYLQLNNRSVHRYIIKAFADVAAACLRPEPRAGKEKMKGDELR